MPESLPPLRCEIRRAPPELTWLRYSLIGVIAAATLVDTWRLAPRRATPTDHVDRRARCGATWQPVPRFIEPAAGAVEPARPVTRVDGILLMRAPPAPAGSPR